MPLKLMYITNDPTVALVAEKNGVDRIWIDLETLGKEERQRNLNTVKSHHTVRDVEVISNLLTYSECLVRVNPWNKGSVKEIEEVILAGADRVMLPMWKTPDEVGAFLHTVRGRVHTSLLLETKEAVECIDSVLRKYNVDEIHIGLNDLHLSYGLTFMFELLSNGIVEKICIKCKEKGVPYGFGGIARLGEGLLPAEEIIMEHYRLGSTRAILSRSFCNTDEVRDIIQIERVFKENMGKLRSYEATMSNVDRGRFEENRHEIAHRVEQIVLSTKKRRG